MKSSMIVKEPESEPEVEVLSFDVDGTLVSKRFTDAVWLRAIPEEYARKEGLCFEDAYRVVKREYEKVGEENIRWYMIDYWLDKFGLDISAEELFLRYRTEVEVYEEVPYVLRKLSEAGYELVISSNAAIEFIEFQIPATLRSFFSHIFSATSNFGEVKKSNNFYTRVCHILGVRPQEVVHIGDHWLFDFLNPRKAGINAYFLDRSRDRGAVRGAVRGGERGGDDGDECEKWEEFIISSLEDILLKLGLRSGEGKEAEVE